MKVGRFSRWIEILLDLPFTVDQIKTDKNVIADTISRWHGESEDIESSEEPNNINN